MKKKESLTQNSICSACLCAGRELQNISNIVSKQFYLSVIQELPLPKSLDSEPQVCWECNCVLKRIILFKEQIKDCYRILHGYTNEDISEISRLPRLSVRCISPINIIPELQKEDDVLDISLVKNEDVNGLELCLIKNEHKSTENLKQENEQSDCDGQYMSDGSDNLYIDETYVDHVVEKCKKKDKAREQIEEITFKEQLKRQKSTATQKLRTIELTYEEMLLERARDALKCNYVNAQYKCDLCLIGFNYVKSYKSHVKNKHSEKLGDYNCPVCKTVMGSVESFTAHYKRHLRRYECLACGKRTMDRKFLMQHYASAHEGHVKEYKCDICDKLSYTIDAHRYHKGTHKKRAECKECDKTFSHRAGLLNHRLTVHKLNKGFPCTVCDKIFRWKASVRKHMEKHNKKTDTPSNQPVCEPCGVTFSSICSYQRHMKNSLKHVTENELRYICDHCNRKFANKTKLRDHIEEKHLHRTYQCSICHKPSKNRVCLDQHIRNVHKGRPKNKICHHCGKGFPTKVQLDSHIRSHTGEKPFICEYCPTTFSQQSNLYKHNRQVHMNIKAKRYPIDRKRKEKSDQPINTIPFYNRDMPTLLHAQDKHDFAV